MNTIRIYETDSHARRLQARVLSCEESENGWLVELDRTIFYPTGGGQPCDMGTLGGADVTETFLRGETVLHRCTAALPAGADVTGEIDWARRLDLMQQHSGEHLVSGLIHARFGYENVGFHLGADLVTIDFNGEVDEQALQELERAANEAVWADFAPHIWYPEPDELARLPYRSKKALTGAVRLVQFGDIDLCACCGTHVARTGEIGLIKLFSTTHFRGGSRIEMACGGRALAVLNALCAQNRDISVRLSAKPVQTAAAVARLASERTEAQQRAAALEDRLFALLAQDGQTLRFEPPMPPESVRRLADASFARTMASAGERAPSGGCHGPGERSAQRSVCRAGRRVALCHGRPGRRPARPCKAAQCRAAGQGRRKARLCAGLARRVPHGHRGVFHGGKLQYA